MRYFGSMRHIWMRDLDKGTMWYRHFSPFFKKRHKGYSKAGLPELKGPGLLVPWEVKKCEKCGRSVAEIRSGLEC